MAYLNNFNPEKVDSVPEVRNQLRFLRKAIDNKEIGNSSNKANIVDLASLQVGSKLEHYSSECVFNLGGYPASSFPIVHDNAVLTVVYAASTFRPEFYVFYAKELTAIYDESNVPDWIKEGFAIFNNENLVVFIAASTNDGKIIQEIQGTLPTDYTDIPKTRFVYYDNLNTVPLSISYTGSITASGMFVEYGSTTPKFLYFTSPYQESSIIGTEVHIVDFNSVQLSQTSEETN